MARLHVGEGFALDTEKFADEGVRVGIFASPGAGKGYLLGVLLEELVGAGYPCVMVDPESELWTFREAGALVLGGPHGHVPLSVTGGMIEEALRFCLDSATPVVFDLGGFEADPEIREAFEKVADAYWRLVSSAREPSVFALTEAHVIAPQTMTRGESAGSKLPAILSRGRKRGVISLLETQRIADVANSVISHCNVRFVGRIDFEDDFKRVAKGLPGVTVDEIQDLARGVFYVPRLADGPISVRERTVTHGAVTPGAGEVTLRREDAPGEVAEVAARLAAIAVALDPEPEAAAPGRAARSTSAGPSVGEAEARERAERAERDRDEYRRRLEGAEARLTDAEAELDRVDALRAAFADIVGGAPEGGGRAYPGDEHVVRLIHANAPAGGAVAVAPVEKLRADYLERTAGRLIEVAGKLEPDERDALLFLIARDDLVTLNEVAKALGGSDSGSVRARWSKAVSSLVSKGLAAQGGSGRSKRRENVRAFIATGLSPHAPTDADVDLVLNRALHVIQGGS